MSTATAVHVSLDMPYKAWLYLNKTAGAFASTDEWRPALACLHFTNVDNRLRVEATDSYMLFRADTDIVVDGKFDVTVPYPWIQRALRMCQKRKKGDITKLVVEEDHCILRNGDERYIVAHSQRNTTFPNFDKLIKSQPDDMLIEPGAFNPQKMSVFSTALAQLNQPVKIEQLHALKPSQVRFEGNWSGVALLMPVRTDW